MFHFEYVQPIPEHAEIIMKWRNDPVTREMSFQTEPFIFEQFYPEFLESYFSIPDLPPLFVWAEGKRVAFIRFRNEEDTHAIWKKCCEISINLVPEERGKGLSVPILQEINKMVARKGYDAIIADIKPKNILSQKVFEKAGYQFIEKTSFEGQEILRYISKLNTNERKPVFIIAEAGSNWRISDQMSKNKEMAYQLIDAAVNAKANAVKFQVFRADTTYVKKAGQSDYLSHSGIHTEIHSLFVQMEMPYEMIPDLAAYCQKSGIEFMASFFSPADFAAIDPYVKRHKIPSYEISHPHLLRLAAKSGKPLFLSTGASEEEDIEWAIREFQKNGGKKLTLLQCTALYPAPPETLHLRTIPYLKNRFHVPVGLSDHSLDPISAPVTAVAVGAVAIEKHFTLSKDLPGPDHVFALTPIELNGMIRSIRETEKMLGSSVKKVRDEEKELYFFARRGIQAIQTIQPGDRLEEGTNFAILRPGKKTLGVHPRFLAEIEGAKAKRTIDEGEGIQFTDWEKI